MPATRAMTSRSAAARTAPHFGSRDDKRRLAGLERGPDLLGAGARAVSLERPEGVMAEARDLEQARQPFYRRARGGEAGESLAHDLLGRLPGRARPPGPRGDPFEPPVALDDRHTSIRLAGEVGEALVDCLE